MNAQSIEEIKKNDLVRKRLAKLMALHCFRNTELENLHAGSFPPSKTKNHSDVKVVSPFGEIPWKDVSRFNDGEMRTLMIDVVNECYRFLFLLYKSPAGDKVVDLLKETDPMPAWNDPL